MATTATLPKSKKSNKDRIRLSVFLLPIMLALVFLSIKMWFPEVYNLIVQEDTAIEWFQAFFFSLGSVFSFLISYHFFKSKLTIHGALYGILAFALLFITLEEISWGQRIFNIENPEFFNQHNMQEEITLHNLKPVAPLLSKLYIMIGLYGAFAWLIAAGMKLNRKIPLIKFFVPDWYLGPYFFFVFLIYTYLSYIRPFAVDMLGIQELEVGYFFIFRDQEPTELLLSMGFFLFAFFNYIRIRKMKEHKHLAGSPVSQEKSKIVESNSVDPFK